MHYDSLNVCRHCSLNRGGLHDSPGRPQGFCHSSSPGGRLEIMVSNMSLVMTNSTNVSPVILNKWCHCFQVVDARIIVLTKCFPGRRSTRRSLDLPFGADLSMDHSAAKPPAEWSPPKGVPGIVCACSGNRTGFAADRLVTRSRFVGACAVVVQADDRISDSSLAHR